MLLFFGNQDGFARRWSRSAATAPVLAIAFLWPTLVLAHVGYGFLFNDRDYYAVGIGFRDEAAFINEPAVVNVSVVSSDKEINPGSPSGNIVAGLEKFLELEVGTIDGAKQILGLSALARPERISYWASFIPTSAGPYTFRLSGLIGDKAQINMEIACIPARGHREALDRSGGQLTPERVSQEGEPSVIRLFRTGSIPCPREKSEFEIPVAAAAAGPESLTEGLLSIFVSSGGLYLKLAIGALGFLLALFAIFVIIRRRKAGSGAYY